MSTVTIVFLCLLGIVFIVLLLWIFISVGVGIMSQEQDLWVEEELEQKCEDLKCDCPNPDYCKNCK